jgi:hypothetical protein
MLIYSPSFIARSPFITIQQCIYINILRIFICISGKSPFVTSSKEFASKSTSEITSTFLTDFQQRFSPILTPIGEIGDRLVTRVSTPINEAIGGAYMNI